MDTLNFAIIETIIIHFWYYKRSANDKWLIDLDTYLFEASHSRAQCARPSELLDSDERPEIYCCEWWINEYTVFGPVRRKVFSCEHVIYWCRWIIRGFQSFDNNKKVLTTMVNLSVVNTKNEEMHFIHKY